MKKAKSTTTLFMIDALLFTLGAVIVLMTIFMIEVRNSDVGVMWFDVEIYFETSIVVDDEYKPSGVSDLTLTRNMGLQETDWILLCRNDQDYNQCKYDTINEIEAFSFSPSLQTSSDEKHKPTDIETSQPEVKAFLQVNNPIDSHTVKFLPSESTGKKMICVMTAQLSKPKCFEIDMAKDIELILDPSGEFSFSQGVEIAFDQDVEI